MGQKKKKTAHFKWSNQNPMDKISPLFPSEYCVILRKMPHMKGFDATNTHRPLLVICKPFIIKEDAISQRNNLIVAGQEYQHCAWEWKILTWLIPVLIHEENKRQTVEMM